MEKYTIKFHVMVYACAFIGGFNHMIKLSRLRYIRNFRINPEFPSWIILPLFLIATIIVIIYRNRLRRKVA